MFECCTLNGHRARTTSHQTAPTPYYRQPSSTLYGTKTFTQFGRELQYDSTNLNCLKSKGWTSLVEEESSNCPTPYYRQPSSTLYGTKTFTQLGRELQYDSTNLNCLKSKGWTSLVEEESSNCPTPYYRQPSSTLYGTKTFTQFGRELQHDSTNHIYLKSKGWTSMVEEPRM